MNKLIAFFEYNNKTFYITKIDNKIHFLKREISSNEISNVSDKEFDIVKEIYNKLLINKNTSIFLKNMQVNNNEYSLYYDRNSRNYFWYPQSGVYNAHDNQYLNFQYNHQPGIIYNNNNNEQENDKFYHRFETIGKKIVLVLISASLCGTMILGQIRGFDEGIINNVLTSYSQNAKYVEQREYNYEDIKNALEENQNIGQEEKEFLYKLKFIFDENHQYMNLNAVIEKLKTLEIVYEDVIVANHLFPTEGSYNIKTNKITCYSKDFKNTSKAIFLHEFLHVLQDNSSHFMLELSNEFFTRETIMKLYTSGLIKQEELVKTETLQRIENLNLKSPTTEESWLHYINMDDGFGNGYVNYVGMYYVLANILPEDVLRNYQFNTKNIDLLATALTELDHNSENQEDALKKAYDLIECINNSRIYNQEKGRIEYAWDLTDCFKKLDYYYFQAKGISVYDDLELVPVLNDMFHHRDPDTRNNKLWNYQKYIENIYGDEGILFSKTYLSNSRENITLLCNGKLIEVSEDVINDYKDFTPITENKTR